MSRCFPFPPPGYVWNKIRDQSLIESIKGAKKEVKKDRKHKKERKRKHGESERHRSKKHCHKRLRKDDIANVTNKVDDHRDSQVEFSEKSCLTVELQTSSQNSYDSTLNSNENQSLSQLLGGRHYDNWVPDRVESKLADFEDQEWWLFVKFDAKRRHHHHYHHHYHHQVSNQKACQGTSSMVWPTARFLPDAELHALPFVVPF